MIDDELAQHLLVELDKRGVSLALKSPSDDGVVYCVAESGPHARAFKVGVTTRPNLRSRISSLQTGNPNPLEVLMVCPGDRELEAVFHQVLSPVRLCGEWFQMSDTSRTRLYRSLAEPGSLLVGGDPFSVERRLFD